MSRDRFSSAALHGEIKADCCDLRLEREKGDAEWEKQLVRYRKPRQARENGQCLRAEEKDTCYIRENWKHVDVTFDSARHVPMKLVMDVYGHQRISLDYTGDHLTFPRAELSGHNSNVSLMNGLLLSSCSSEGEPFVRGNLLLFVGSRCLSVAK